MFWSAVSLTALVCAAFFPRQTAGNLSGNFRVPAYPLAVRTPYLSAWLHGDLAGRAPTAQAQFWSNQTLGWQIAARVDGHAYSLFGFPDGLSGGTEATQTSISMSSTHTNITLTAGAATFHLDFFSPVSPKDYVRYSLPFSYLTVSASAPGSDIEILSATDEAWTAQEGSVSYTKYTTGATSLFGLYNPGQTLYQESRDMAQWGSFLHGSRPSSSSTLSSQCGTASGVLGNFVNNGSLSGQSTHCPSQGLVAFSHQLGPVSTTASVTFAVGLEQDSAIDFYGTAQTPYYRTQYSSIAAAFSAFLDDYPAALAESWSIDSLVLSQGHAVSTKYADILQLGVRQVFGATELAIQSPSTAHSTTRLWVKEISSDGNVNTLDVLYPTFPIWYLLNPDLIRLSLQPILEYTVHLGKWNEPYAIHDIGSVFPKALGHDDDRAEFMPIQSSTNLLILAYAYQKATGDTTWAAQWRDIFLQYGDYLVAHGNASQSQLSSVDAIPESANQTQLAALSAVGLASLGQMFGLSNYTSAGQSLAHQLYTTGLGLDSARTHFTYNYPSTTAHDRTWSPFPPLFVDSLLELDLFPSSASTLMSTWYSENLHAYGLPYREIPNPTGQSFGIIDWSFWAAATSSDAVRDSIIEGAWKFLSDGDSNVPFQTKYDVDSGEPIANIARSTVG